MLKIEISPDVANYLNQLLMERPIKEAGAIHADFVRKCEAAQAVLNEEQRQAIVDAAKKA